MPSWNPQIPQTGQPDASEEPKIASDFTSLATLLNGGLDDANVTAGFAASAGVNQSGGAKVKGATNIATSETTTSTSFTTLPTPDQVTGIVLPANGLITILYQATWQESVQLGGSAAIFIGANQLTRASPVLSGPQAQSAVIGPPTTASTAQPLSSYWAGLASTGTIATGAAYTGDVTTGQVVSGGLLLSGTGGNLGSAGGPCYVFASAGTYTVSVRFKASSGSVTVSNRQLWVRAESFA